MKVCAGSRLATPDSAFCTEPHPLKLGHWRIRALISTRQIATLLNIWNLFPSGTWRLYNVASTSMQHHDVASTLMRRLNVVWPWWGKMPGILTRTLVVLRYERASGPSRMRIGLVIRKSWVRSLPGPETFFRRNWLWNVFYCHSVPSTDSRRAVVSFRPKNVHNTG